MELNEIIHELFQAAQSGDALRLQAILEAHRVLANTENADGLTPLGYAAHFGNKDAVQILLDYGASVDAVSHSKVSYIPSNTALHAAIAGERELDVIRLLLAHQANTTIFDSNGHTCLHSAAFHDDNVEMIRLLIEHGADVNARVEGGETALSLAIQQGNPNVAELLRQHGAVE
ncbi:ankyrin repeat domain-containing protein [Paenibacillus sp. MMS18-CY102]|uniref:ankyrin repeat domain-containing protein n=1 Tax=Paenibacillus sp. MMS18-CY102 TaxID=2682849 RepID=UPI00136531FC|nr:ankyrin repeat domain-containing protein [Paenibacillus sp. MMS18-CY102]MWC27707.1 ankyrin repeat domain-containing protein [Paenibacillus sp. MMS18-CY102]